MNTSLFAKISCTVFSCRFPVFELLPGLHTASAERRRGPMPPLPPKDPLQQMQESFHGETHKWPAGWAGAFEEVRVLLQEQLGVSLSQYDCLDQGEWLRDDVMHLFVDCLQRGIPEPQSDASQGVSPPSQIRTGGNALLLDLNEVCILDPQHAKVIQLAFETSDYRACLKMLKGKCRFHTAKRILLPLNTSGSEIAMQSGSHWMLAELDFTSNEVAIYDWLAGMDLEEYNHLAGVSL